MPLRVSRRKGRWLSALAASVALVVAAGCGGSDGGPEQAESQVPITFSLDFNFDGLHSPFLIAQEKGWYADAGLDVAIQPSGGSQDSLTRIASGAADLGVVSSSVVLTGIANEQHPVKVVGMLLQHDAAATQTREELNVSKPADLVGLTVATPPASALAQFFPALLELNDIDPAEVKTIAINPAAAKQTLLGGQAEATNIFGPVFADVTDRVDNLYWYKFGLDIYGSTISANTDFLAERPQAVEQFLEVSMRGLEYVIDNPDEAGDLVAERAAGDPKFFRAEVKEFLQFYDPSAAPEGPGTMDEARWRKTQELNVSYGAQDKEIPLDQVYTNEFLTGGS